MSYNRIRSKKLWFPAVLAGLFLAVYVPLTQQVLQINDGTAAATAASTSRRTVVIQNKQAVTPAPQTTTAPTTAVPNCTPISAGTPSKLAIATSTAGLSTQTDTPIYYQIYGTTADQLRNQIRSCAPGANGNSSAEFTAETSYSLAWAYDYSDNGNACTISNIRVGLHTTMALPLWQTQAGATHGLSDRWATFMQALTIHEQGHVTLDKQYAAQLTGDLQTLSGASCTDLANSVTATVNRDVTALNQANDKYDAQTNHGATQGAILPTN